MVRTWLEATGTEPIQLVGGFVWPDESDRGPVATEMHARLVAHLEDLVTAGEVDPDRLLASDAVALAAHEKTQVDWLHTELEDGRQPIWAVSDEGDEGLLAAWADADADARQILTDLLDGSDPGAIPDDEVLAAWMSLQHADWIGAVVPLVIGGPGAVADTEALGALDEDQRLTELGWWGLPEALHRAWGGTADATE